MASVPEGPADRSQARSAWIAMQRDPVPEGRSKGRSHCQSQEREQKVLAMAGLFSGISLLKHVFESFYP
jgi:hypothetical protein